MLDAIIIGAGYGGMGVAALLARSGFKIMVIEQASLIGGRASFFSDEDGYRWEYGAHSHRLAEMGIANQLFLPLGRRNHLSAKVEMSAKARIYKNQLSEKPEGRPNGLPEDAHAFRFSEDWPY